MQMPGNVRCGVGGSVGSYRLGPPGLAMRRRRVMVGTALIALAASALASTEEPSATQALYTSEAPSQSNVIHGAMWAPPPPAACGDLGQYEAIVVYGTEGPDDPLPLDGEHPPPQPDNDKHHPEPQPSNKGQIILGLGGDDVIYGGNAKDCLVGGAGDDTIYGNNGSDIILGGPGNDELWGDNGPDDLGGGEDDDLLIGGKGVDDLDGGEGTDECYGLTADGDGKGGNSEKDTLTMCESGTSGAQPKLMTVVPEESVGSASDDPNTDSSVETAPKEVDEGEHVASGSDDAPVSGPDADAPGEIADDAEALSNQDLPLDGSGQDPESLAVGGVDNGGTGTDPS